MSFAAHMTAIYRLFYRQSVREAFFAMGKPPVDGLSESELASLRAIPRARLGRIVELHRGDIGRGWYQPRFPASWLALQAALGVAEDSVVAMLTESQAFELRVNDDADGRALAAFVGELEASDRLAEAPWLPELLDYERLLNGAWGGLESCRWIHGSLALKEFTWDAAGIRDSLTNQDLFPTGEEPAESLALFCRDVEGVSEAQVDGDTADAVAVVCGLADNASAGNPGRKAIQDAKRLLRDLGWAEARPSAPGPR